MLVLVVLMALAETSGVVSIVPFLSALTRPDIVQHNAVMQWLWEHFGFVERRSFIVALGLGSMAIVVTSTVFKTITLHLLNRHVQFLRHHISCRLLARYLAQPYEFFLGTNSATLSRNVLTETDQLANQLLTPLSQLIAQGAVMLAMLLLLLWYSPSAAVGILAVLGTLYGVVYGIARKRLARIGEERVTADGARFQACNEALHGIKDVKVTGSASAYEQQYAKPSRLLARHQALSDTLAQAPLYLVEATGYSLLIVLALLLMTQSSDVARVLPALGLYGFAAYRMLPAAQIMYRGFAKLRYSTASIEALHHGLELPAGRDESQPVQPLKLGEAIRLENVSYAYPTSLEKPVFKNFNLHVPIGSSIGIAGPSGAGKSTLMDLLLGLLEPNTGSLTVDGVPIDAKNVRAWQRSLGYVPQQIYLADASVAENIALGVELEEIDTSAVERAARIAQIHDFVIHELPEGYATKLGDRGMRLSGGQRQRIGIARALYRDPTVILLDEATSALDVATETAVNKAMRSLAGTKTVIFITHRLASLEGCDQVIQLLHPSKQKGSLNAQR